MTPTKLQARAGTFVQPPPTESRPARPGNANATCNPGYTNCAGALRRREHELQPTVARVAPSAPRARSAEPETCTAAVSCKEQYDAVRYILRRHWVRHVEVRCVRRGVHATGQRSSHVQQRLQVRLSVPRSVHSLRHGMHRSTRGPEQLLAVATRFCPPAPGGMPTCSRQPMRSELYGRQFRVRRAVREHLE